MKMPLKFVGGALFTVAVTVAVACSHSENGANLANASNPSVSPSTAAAPVPNAPQSAEDKMPRVNVEDTKKLLADGQAILIDVRGTDSYNAIHIKGALDFPLAKMENGDFKGLPKDKRIIAYCT
jgi:3-mercaptopyruvate sulfurtransferase SseA